ncbi:hypothetical protein HYALB_00003763 [Hymenoscyphus albidus]|uniref:PRISE-like Rossmann-fold domain-containing protein n=1 Tax=Hymenoscyphus albidus TaxID=595503 RepID=A0A9N9QA94_9HELO|nr:hypothetical protein HYALB_00003763 [Hymenoscyphus albidus]
MQVCAYAAHGSEFQISKEVSVLTLETAVKAITNLCLNLEFWTLQTGGKAYGVEFYGQPGVQWDLPLKETSPRIPEPSASNIFYYPQIDFLASESKDKSWKHCKIRPDLIMGHTPRPNGMGFLHALGVFLSMYASVEGKGTEIAFPGNEMSWKVKQSDTSQDILARFHIFASLNPEKVAGKAVNVADEYLKTWEKLWPDVCAYFGLKGVGPQAEGNLNGVEWVMAEKDNWGTWVESNGLEKGFRDVLGAVFAWGVFDKEYDLTASREVGFMESAPTIEGYITAFERTKKAKVIPA